VSELLWYCLCVCGVCDMYIYSVGAACGLCTGLSGCVVYTGMCMDGERGKCLCGHDVFMVCVVCMCMHMKACVSAVFACGMMWEVGPMCHVCHVYCVYGKEGCLW
jgi:hypothetical protein